MYNLKRVTGKTLKKELKRLSESLNDNSLYSFKLKILYDGSLKK